MYLKTSCMVTYIPSHASNTSTNNGSGCPYRVNVLIFVWT